MGKKGMCLDHICDGERIEVGQTARGLQGQTDR